MDTQTQIDRLIELAIVQRSELKQLVSELPQLREYLGAEIERTFEETEPQIRTELEEFCRARASDEHAKTGAALAAKVEQLSKQLEVTTAAKYSVLMAERAENANLLAKAEARIEDAASMLSHAVKEIVTDELSRFPRAGEIDQLRKEFAEPRGLNPRGRWMPDETYQRLDLVTINGDSFVSNIDGNRERPSRTAGDWTLSAARGNGGGGGGVTTMTDLVPVPTDGQLLIGNGSAFVNATLTAGTGISISNGPGSITINATDGNITLDDGTAAAPSLNFTSDTNTGLYRPAADTVGIVGGGHDIVRLTDVASATDYLEIKNAIGVATPLHVLASGPSTNIGMHLQPKGSGLLTISDGTDFNKGIRFRSSSSSASAITLLDAVSTAGRVITLPDATDTLVGKATTDTLTNKTLTSPTLTTPISATLTAPASTNLTLTSGLVGTNRVNFPDTLSASSATAGAVTIGNGTAATNVAIGGGKVNIGDTTAGSSGAGALVVAGGISVGNTGAASYFGGAVTSVGAITLDATQSLTRALIIGLLAQSGGNTPYVSIRPVATFADFALGIENTNSTSGQGLGLRIIAGSTASDLPIFVRDRTNATTLFSVGGTGAATFAGAVTANGNLTVGSSNVNQLLTIQSATAGSGQGAALVLKNNTTIIGYFGRSSYISSGAVNTDAPAIAGTTGLGINFFVNDSTNALALASTGAATFAGAVTVTGALKLGNAYVAGAVVGTGSITIQDSTGTTYRIPVLV